VRTGGQILVDQLEINRADLELWRKLVKEAGIPLE